MEQYFIPNAPDQVIENARGLWVYWGNYGADIQDLIWDVNRNLRLFGYDPSSIIEYNTYSFSLCFEREAFEQFDGVPLTGDPRPILSDIAANFHVGGNYSDDVERLCDELNESVRSRCQSAFDYCSHSVRSDWEEECRIALDESMLDIFEFLRVCDAEFSTVEDFKAWASELGMIVKCDSHFMEISGVEFIPFDEMFIWNEKDAETFLYAFGSVLDYNPSFELDDYSMFYEACDDLNLDPDSTLEAIQAGVPVEDLVI